MKFEDFSWKLMVNGYGTDEIEMVLDSMDPVWKMVIILRHGEGLQMPAIADLMGYRKVNTVWNYYWDGMRKLYDYFHPKESLWDFWGTQFNRKLSFWNNSERAGYWEWLIYRHPGSHIQAAIDTMQAETRVVLLLHHGDNKNFEEIAELMCCTTSTVQSIYSRGIDKLYSWFRHWYPKQDRQLLKAYLEFLIESI